MKLPIPTIHTNGTSAKSLTEQARNVYSAIGDTLEATAQARPHGRDYYPQGDLALQSAQDAHRNLERQLADIQQAYLDYALAIMDLGKL